MTLPCVEQLDFDSAFDYLHYLRPSERHWGDGADVSWFFRGQADHRWALIPSSPW